ncbi:AraC family transcriptional regulator [Piscinibacter gummiphilus]|uniref:AraC family transcriptional regulator n=1 Tax=Piscinibacter gummiphilus TaxID=946333 RepID=A0A1W6L4F4_9BURK|nr:AraC family transcriptional regulator [Piscinibacter gummiphilus]ARN19066.1 AraC family transcriptional regulator [Piscinibacter gummiphilus]ATU63715.1 AraC family transcriptional regulator [Piscinibacter gummiphilus]GLS93351.1 transcriptional regulator [Piscinibacter gummiphilus]
MFDSLSPSLRADPSAAPLQVAVLRAELAALIERLSGGRDGAHVTAIPRLRLARLSQAQQPSHTVHEPAFCVLAQGSKRVLLGEETYLYDSSQFLVVSQNLPVSSQVTDLSPEAPYLGLRLDFDVKEIAALALELGLAHGPAHRAAQRGLFTGELGSALLDPVLRLVRLLDAPDDIPTLAPLVSREILYRLLRSPDGWRLAQMATADGHGQRIAQAIAWLTQRYQAPLRVEELADAVHMSVSSLHHHFKTVTAMSPLQFQKRLRLQEARRILLCEHVDAATAGHRVGYESQSQFNREYSRFFGSPPARDARRLREQQLGRQGR